MKSVAFDFPADVQEEKHRAWVERALRQNVYRFCGAHAQCEGEHGLNYTQESAHLLGGNALLLFHPCGAAVVGDRRFPDLQSTRPYLHL